MSMFASASQVAKPTKRAAEEAPSTLGERSASSWRSATQPNAREAPWKRARTDAVETAMTQPVQPQHRPMLGAWFGAARAAASQQQQPRQQPAFARAATSLSQDSEDDKPLARRGSAKLQQQTQQTDTHPLDWKQKKELQRMQAKRKGKATPSPPQAKTGFKTAREAARQSPTGRASNTNFSSAVATRVDGNEDERVFQLSTKRRVTVRRWKSTVLVDIREYYDDNGVSKPGKKGISLAKDQWNTLLRMAPIIDEAVALVEEDRVDGSSMDHVKERIPINEDRTIAFTLSSKRRITVRFFRAAVLIDLREYYEQGSEMKPGKKGISLSKDQWRSLQHTEAEISQAIDEV